MICGLSKTNKWFSNALKQGLAFGCCINSEIYVLVKAENVKGARKLAKSFYLKNYGPFYSLKCWKTTEDELETLDFKAVITKSDIIPIQYCQRWGTSHGGY